jgi:hypothetical protein
MLTDIALRWEQKYNPIQIIGKYKHFSFIVRQDGDVWIATGESHLSGEYRTMFIGDALEWCQSEINRIQCFGYLEVLGKQCMDGGTCHHDCTIYSGCFRKACCAPLSCSGLNDEWEPIMKSLEI